MQFAPQECQPNENLIKKCQDIANDTGATIMITDDVKQGVAGCDFVYTDVWLSMGEPTELWEKRIEQLLPYQVNQDLMKMSDNPNVKFLHCLPALHNRNTKIGEEIFQKFGLDAMEVTDEVFESDASLVFDEAENRMHTIKAVMVAALG